MSRDWTPRESYLVEQQQIADGRGDKWDFMRNLKYVPLGEEPVRAVSDEELSIRMQFPVIGKFAGNFMELYSIVSNFEGGFEFLREKDAEISAYIATGKGDPDSYFVKWFFGELDENFYYRERNDQLLLESICKEALEKGLNNWVITDPDCMQIRRQVGFESPGVFQLLQIDEVLSENGGDKPVYRLAWAEIDLSDYSDSERSEALRSFGYDCMKNLVSAAGSWKEAYGQLAEMYFENGNEFYVNCFDSWNEAINDIVDRTGLDLDIFKQVSQVPLDKQIEQCASQVVNRDLGAEDMYTEKER